MGKDCLTRSHGHMVVMETHLQAAVCSLMLHKDPQHSVIPKGRAHSEWEDSQCIGSVWVSAMAHQLLCSFNLVAG